MRGKSVDAEFISVFIEKCVQKDKVTPKDIAHEAKIKINDIDHKIKMIEELKKERSKLIDVISSFDLPEEENELEDSIVQESDQECLKDDFISKVFEFVQQNEGSSITEILSRFHRVEKEKVYFAIKQLISSSLVERTENNSFKIKENDTKNDIADIKNQLYNFILGSESTTIKDIVSVFSFLEKETIFIGLKSLLADNKIIKNNKIFQVSRS